MAPALEEAWRRGCRLDGWRECFQPEIWWQTFADLGIDADWYSQRNRPMTEVLPWDHVNVKKGREYLEKEQNAQPDAAAGDGGREVARRSPAELCSQAHVSAQEAYAALHDPRLLICGYAREERQGQHAAAGLFRCGEFSHLVSQMGEAFLTV